jgi:maltose O-acetyltransferase
MSEYEQMISGQLYNANDPELELMRRQARARLDQLNHSIQDVKSGERLDICQKLFGKTGKGLWLQPPFYCEYGSNIELGDNVFFNFNCVVLDVAKVTIGSYVLIGPNVQIYTATHPLDAQKRREGQELGKPIVIGDDVWIGGSAVICPGVTIGNKSVIGAGAVVVKDVPPNVVVGGNPAKVLKNLPDGPSV